MTCSHSNKYKTGFGKVTYDYCPDCKEEVKAEAFEEQSENPCASIAAEYGWQRYIPIYTRIGDFIHINGKFIVNTITISASDLVSLYPKSKK